MLAITPPPVPSVTVIVTGTSWLRMLATDDVSWSSGVVPDATIDVALVA